MEICIIKWKEQCQLFFFLCCCYCGSRRTLFSENYFRRWFLFFLALSLLWYFYSCEHTHYYRCFFSVALAGVISYVDARILTHLITFAEADAGAGIQCVGGLCLCYRNKRFQWLYAVCVAA